MHSQQSSTSSINSHVARTSQQRTRRRKRRTSDCFFFWSSSTYLRAPICRVCQQLCRLFPGRLQSRLMQDFGSTYFDGVGLLGLLVSKRARNQKRNQSSSGSRNLQTVGMRSGHNAKPPQNNRNCQLASLVECSSDQRNTKVINNASSEEFFYIHDCAYWPIKWDNVIEIGRVVHR